MEPLVSIIIPTHKGRDLTRCLDSIHNSTYKNIEVIIVDEGKERSAQRNIGVERSKGDYLLFLDSDMTIHSSLIFSCIHRPFGFGTQSGIGSDQFGYDGLYIPEIIVGHPIKTFFRSFYNGTRVDAIRFIKRKFWQPFDENITGFEDWDWDRRFQGSKGVVNIPLYHHTESNFKRKLYYMKWLNLYKQKYPNCPELSLSYRLFKVFIENGKWRKFFGIQKGVNHGFYPRLA